MMLQTALSLTSHNDQDQLVFHFIINIGIQAKDKLEGKENILCSHNDISVLDVM